MESINESHLAAQCPMFYLPISVCIQVARVFPFNHPCVIYEIYTRVWVLVILQWMSALCANLTITYMAQRVICVEIIVNCPQTARQGLYSKSYRARVPKAFQNQDQDQAQVKN